MVTQLLHEVHYSLTEIKHGALQKRRSYYKLEPGGNSCYFTYHYSKVSL